MSVHGEQRSSDGEESSCGMFITDLDGTLRREETVDPADILALEHLGSLGIPRIIATGRSPYSFMRFAGEHHLPVDYLVLSSGAAVMECCTGEYLRSVSMSADQTSAAVGVLTGMELDFTIHRQIPDNHRFLYSMPSGDNPDMDRRIDLYRSHCSPLGMEGHASPSTQLVVISPPERSEGLLPLVSEALGEEYSVLRTTSPLDGRSLWIEVFPSSVSKSAGVGWLASKLGYEDCCSAAVGNDYNDLDLLEWAARPFVIQGSPQDFMSRFRCVGSVAEAVNLWLSDWDIPAPGSS